MPTRSAMSCIVGRPVALLLRDRTPVHLALARRRLDRGNLGTGRKGNLLTVGLGPENSASTVNVSADVRLAGRRP
jgi:hypothetical protein